MPPRKHTRAASQEGKKTPAISYDNLYVVFGYNDEQLYIPFKSCTIYVTIMQPNPQPPLNITSSLMYARLGIKRTYYTVYSSLNKMSIYKTEKPELGRKAIPFSSILFTNDEKKFNISLSSCFISTPTVDGHSVTCKVDQLVLAEEHGGKTFMFKDCFFHEEFSSQAPVILKKNKKPELPEQVHEIERSQPSEPTHMGIYS